MYISYHIKYVGTVDIACHQVLLGEYCVEEIHCPTGGPWGSDCIDYYFDELLCEIFTKKTIGHIKTTEPALYIKIKKNFSKSKMSFYDKPHDKFHGVQLTVDFVTNITVRSILFFFI